MSRVLVCGGRNYTDRKTVYDVLDDLHAETPITELAHGACPYGGADILAEDWAKAREVPYRGYPAKFKSVGRAAGPQRNAYQLVDFRPDLVVVFSGGRGTADMARRANDAGVQLLVVGGGGT